ncbi:Glycogen recognition site of AMP-activated protein kinase [Fodinibius roseus]|uniref:Glycogen recognition site of AMP-activated protein kinase n=1 Tax=Fodinibius roseus TaxID=1194090 RepID=A0A1M4TRF9_9BACT|nr:hypothetical protein [Fodinibius roseus]SHE46998.1 Glycogen recognition site of AMP-activated protein kinase [Fodinibius roseus]
MKNREELFQQYVDGELSPQEEKQALHKIAEDDELRSMLRFEHQLNDTAFVALLQSEADPVPEGFSERVMQEVYGMGESSDSLGVTGRLQAWYRSLWIPKQIQWRPAYALAIAVILLFSLGYPLYMVQDMGNERPFASSESAGLNDSVRQISSGDGGEEVILRFFYIDEEAQSVSVAGDFNDWEPVELTRQEVNGEEVWTGFVSVKRGEHHYMFVKNGEQWVTDPLAPVHRDDGFGNKNAVIYL